MTDTSQPKRGPDVQKIGEFVRVTGYHEDETPEEPALVPPGGPSQEDEAAERHGWPFRKGSR